MPCGAQLRGGADAGQHQQLRRVEGAAGEDDLAPRARPAAESPPLPPGRRVGAVEVRALRYSTPIARFRSSNRTRVASASSSIRSRSGCARGDIEDPLAGADALVRCASTAACSRRPRTRRGRSAGRSGRPRRRSACAGCAAGWRPTGRRRAPSRAPAAPDRRRASPRAAAHFRCRASRPSRVRSDRSRIGRGGATAAR